MSNLFAGISNVQFPQSVWNSGPLPPEGGLPAPLNNPFDARYNYGATLLGDLDPYAYGHADRIQNQVSYTNKPHSIQKIIPELQLPRGQVGTQSTFPLSHSIDDSEIAFVMRLDRDSYMCSAMGAKSLHRQKIGTTIDPMINLATLNYLLAGFQLSYVPGRQSKWADLLHHLDKERFPDERHVLTLKDIRHIVRDLIRPFGVMRGSEKQGGQDETGLSPATYPVNFVCNLVLDGHERNMVNIWCFHEVQAGDDLVLCLKPMPIPQRPECYTLNSYYKSVARQDFETYFEGTPTHLVASHVWQLVPEVMSLDCAPMNDSFHNPVMPKPVHMAAGLHVPQDYLWQEFGYWHIGRSQVQFRKYAGVEFYNNTMFNLLKVNHLDMTFEPAWCKVPGEEGAGPRSYLPTGAPAPGFVPAPGMRDEFQRPTWAPSLGLELRSAPVVSAPMPHMSSMPSLSDMTDAPGGTSDVMAVEPAPVPPSTSAASPMPEVDFARRKTALASGFGDLFRQRMSATVAAVAASAADSRLGDLPEEMPPSAGIDLLATPVHDSIDIDALPGPSSAQAPRSTTASPASTGSGGGAATPAKKPVGQKARKTLVPAATSDSSV